MKNSRSVVVTMLLAAFLTLPLCEPASATGTQKSFFRGAAEGFSASGCNNNDSSDCVILGMTTFIDDALPRSGMVSVFRLFGDGFSYFECKGTPLAKTFTIAPASGSTHIDASLPAQIEGCEPATPFAAGGAQPRSITGRGKGTERYRVVRNTNRLTESAGTVWKYRTTSECFTISVAVVIDGIAYALEGEGCAETVHDKTRVK